jgi:hypothetical protein
MNGRDHLPFTPAWQYGRRLSLFVLALALAGCAGGRATDTAVLTGSPEVGVPASPVTSGPGAAGSGLSGSGSTGAGATGAGAAASGRGPAVTAPPTSADDAAVDLEVGGPSVGIPATLPAPLQSFGEVAVGSENPPRRFRLRASGGAAVEVLALTIKGDGSFALTDDQCTGATLAPGGPGGCALAVAFRPHQEGAASGELVARLAQAGNGQVASVRDRAVARLAGHGTTAGL